MALLFLFLLGAIFVFFFYYELLWKRIEQEQGKSLLGMAGDFVFSKEPVYAVGVAVKKKAVNSENPWKDWKYRLMVELHRRGQIKSEEAAEYVGVAISNVEKYLDSLEEEGKVQSAGDSKRGIFYRIVNQA